VHALQSESGREKTDLELSAAQPHPNLLHIASLWLNNQTCLLMDADKGSIKLGHALKKKTA